MGSELGPLPGVDQAVDAETVVEVAVELSALRVVVHPAVEMQAVAVLGRPRVLPAVVQLVGAQGCNVPVGQLVHQSQGALPARGPGAQRAHAAVEVVKTRGRRGQSRRRRRRRALVAGVHGLRLGGGRPQQLGTV